MEKQSDSQEFSQSQDFELFAWLQKKFQKVNTTRLILIPIDAYLKWEQQYKDASTSLLDREVTFITTRLLLHQIRVEKVYDLLENNLHYVGSSAIEDALQEGVPETLEALRQAGIICWMLTGDKKETAIQIGYSCKLIPGKTPLLKLIMKIQILF